MNATYRLFVCLCSILFSATQLKAMQEDFRYTRSLTIENGLPHSDANALAQDQNGMIWIGTYSGLARYDGYEIKRFYLSSTTTTRAYDNRIAHIAIHDSLIWLATDGGLKCFDMIHEKYANIEGALHQILYSTFVDSKNNIYTISNQYELCKYKVSSPYKLSQSPVYGAPHLKVKYITETKEQEILLATDQGLFHLKDDTLQKIRLFAPEKELINNIRYIFIDSRGYLFLHNNDDLYRSLTKFSIKEGYSSLDKLLLNQDINQLTKIVETDGKYYFSTHSGLYQLELNNNTCKCDRFLPSRQEINYINDLLLDRSGCLFTASYANGVNIYTPKLKQFNKLYFGNNCIPLPKDIIRAIVKFDNILWIGTNTNGIIGYDLITHKTIEVNENIKLKSPNIRALAMGEKGILWIGSDKGIDAFDTYTSKLCDFNNQLPHDEVSTIQIDQWGQVWVGGWHNGLYRIKKNGKHIYYVTHLANATVKSIPQITSDRIYAININKEYNYLYFSTEKELIFVQLDSQGEIADIKLCREDDSVPSASKTHFICSITQENDSILWLGTIGNGIMRAHFKQKYIFTPHYFNDTNFPMKDVEVVMMDKEHNIWCAGNGIIKIEPLSNNIKQYDVNDGLSGNGFKVGSYFTDSSGTFYLGGTNGVTYFKPSEIKENKIPAIPCIIQLRVNNELINPLGPDSILQQSISYASNLTLSYTQNNFSLSFSSLDYTCPSKCQFRYRIPQLSSDWQYLPFQNHTAYFSNLPYGTYTIYVQCSNSDEIWSDKTVKLDFTILPPWWKSPLAYLCYSIFILLILSCIIRYTLSWMDVKGKLKIKQIEELNIKKQKEFQSQFFTNISHELRTPITILLNEVAKMYEEGYADSHQKIISRNVHSLLSLVNELLDFKQVESEEMKLHIREFNFIQLFRNIAQEFSSISETNHINYIIDIPENEEQSVWMDPSIIEKIILNILNNAFKYTKGNGDITIQYIGTNFHWIPEYTNCYKIESPLLNNQLIWIKISDTGIGVDKESINKIFNKFYQINDTENNTHLGSGLGLALVYSLIKLHQSALYVSSERYKGTEFIVGFPYLSFKSSISGTTHPSDIITQNEENKDSLPKHSFSTLLIVEDNKDILYYLKDEMKAHYLIYTASNGQEAMKIIKECQIDLIISDWMMPVMNGLELCKSLKENPNYATIPFIMLTAKNSMEAQIECIEFGANAYITKPFSIQLLKKIISNLLKSQTEIKSHIINNYISESVKTEEKVYIKNINIQFIKAVEENINNPDLNIEDLCRLLNTSKSKLYKDIHTIYNRPIMDMVRYIRLKKAIQYMAETDKSIQDIILLIGIQSQSYFTRAFKNEFGVTPTKYLQQEKDKKRKEQNK